jgi:hypothetical protein
LKIDCLIIIQSDGKLQTGSEGNVAFFSLFCLTSRFTAFSMLWRTFKDLIRRFLRGFLLFFFAENRREERKLSKLFEQAATEFLNLLHFHSKENCVMRNFVLADNDRKRQFFFVVCSKPTRVSEIQFKSLWNES